MKKKIINVKIMEIFIIALISFFTALSGLLLLGSLTIAQPDPSLVIITLLTILIILSLIIIYFLIKLWEYHILPLHLKEIILKKQVTDRKK